MIPPHPPGFRPHTQAREDEHPALTATGLALRVVRAAGANASREAGMGVWGTGKP